MKTILCLAALVLSSLASFAQGTAITYQGRLNVSGTVANGSYDLGFVVCSEASGANFVSGIITNTATAVSNGLFTVTLDFGAGIFDGSDRWLQIFVRTNGAGGFSSLSPRQALTAAPYAITAGTITGSLAAGQLSGPIAAANIAADTITSAMLAAGSVTTDKLAVNAVTTSKLSNGVVTLDKLTNGLTSLRLATFKDPESYSHDYFGSAAATVGTDLVAIGAPYQDHGVHVFNTDGTYEIVLTNPVHFAFSDFGRSVAGLNTDKVLVGAPLDDTGATDSGAAYLIDIDGTHISTFTNPTPAINDQFGIAVAAVGTKRVLVGAWAHNGAAFNTGAAYLFNTNGTLLASFLNSSTRSNEYFGHAVALVGTDKLLIGAHGTDAGGYDSAGVARLYTTNGTLQESFTNPTPATLDFFGFSLAALDASRVLIGTYDGDAAYLFHTNGTLLATFDDPENFGNSFGRTVAAVGTDKVLIGASGTYDDETGTSDSGVAYLFSTNGTLLTTIRNPSPRFNDLFGTAVAAFSSGEVVITTSITTGGEAYLFGFDSYVPRLIAARVTDGGVTAGSFDSTIGVWLTSYGGIYYPGHYVGIGTDAPQAGLHIKSANEFVVPKIILEPYEGNSRSEIHFYETPSLNAGWILRDNGSGANNAFQFLGVTNGVETGVFLNILRTGIPGAVGIGRVPSANLLEVDGDASKTTASAWLANSDRRIKQDIQPVQGALDLLARVRPVSFRYTDDYRTHHRGVEDRRYLNVVAQEFREVFPDHVKSSGEKLPDGSEILQVDTYPLTIYSAAAIQELNQKLKDELKKRDTENAELKARLEKLERLMSEKIGGGK